MPNIEDRIVESAYFAALYMIPEGGEPDDGGWWDIIRDPRQANIDGAALGIPHEIIWSWWARWAQGTDGACPFCVVDGRRLPNGAVDLMYALFPQDPGSLFRGRTIPRASTLLEAVGGTYFLSPENTSVSWQTFRMGLEFPAKLTALPSRRDRPTPRSPSSPS